MKIRVEIIEEFSDKDLTQMMQSGDAGAFIPIERQPVPVAQLSYLILPIEMKAGQAIELVLRYSNKKRKK